MDINDRIINLAEDKNALIIAHNYQPLEIQEIAHLTGDSLELSRISSESSAEIVVFCGVHFMAESASILSPNKKILLPVMDAGCPMADMADVAGISKLKRRHPSAMVVCYINTSARVKAESDIVCTSSNAIKIVESLKTDSVIFVPDRNLADYVARNTDKKIIPYPGFCPVHMKYTVDKLIQLKTKYPDALTMSHPECRREVLDASDVILSTGGMLDYVKNLNPCDLIVVTESGMIDVLKKINSRINYIPASHDFICPDMKKIDKAALYTSLKNEQFEVKVDDNIRVRALKSLERMLELS